MGTAEIQFTLIESLAPRGVTETFSLSDTDCDTTIFAGLADIDCMDCTDNSGWVEITASSNSDQPDEREEARLPKE